jgi:GrpB-like predicted nucleotidyltransferase (UPF0157 family)
MERYGGGAILIQDYDLRWPAMFADEWAHIAVALGSVLVTVEHVGSTAVPGLAAKPIIDLLVGVRSLTQARSTCVAPLQQLGYVYLPEYESWLPEELFFRQGPPGPWTHHVHLMEPTAVRWGEQLLFRDYLRAHPEVAQEYGQLKRALAAAVGDDVVGFRAGKRPFIQAVLAKARAEMVLPA